MTQVRSSDDVQVLAVVGLTQASSFTLQFGNQTTAPIPLSPIPPLTSFAWFATLSSVGSYDLGLAWGEISSTPGCTQSLIEIFDNGVLIGSVPIDQSIAPDPSVDLGVSGVGIFKSLGTFKFSTTQLEVRLSGSANNGTLLAGMLRLVPTGSTDPTTIGYIDPSPNRANGSNGAVEGRSSAQYYGPWGLTFYYSPVASWHGLFVATPSGTQPAKFCSPADVQSALQSLSSVPPGGVAVTALDSEHTSIHFTGNLSGQACSTLISSDPAFAITHDGTQGSTIGGQVPTATINGVQHPVKASSFAAGQPFVVFHLIQDAPAIQYLRFEEGLFQGGYLNVGVNIGFAGRVGYATNAGVAGTWPFQGLPGTATYEVDVTWPANDPSADVCEYQIQDGLGNILLTVSGVDQSKAPNDFVEGGVGWKKLGQMTLSAQLNNLSVVAIGPGNPNKHVLLDTVRLSRVSSPQSVVIQPTDVVTFDAVPGFIVTNLGPMAAATNLLVGPPPSSRLPGLPTATKTMKLGINCDPPSYYGVDSCFANMAIQSTAPLGIVQDSLGNPTELSYFNRYDCGVSLTPLTQPPADCGGRGYGVPNSSSGLWVVQWLGSDWNYCGLVSNNATTSVVEETSNRISGFLNRRFFQVQEATISSPTLALGVFSTQKNADGNYACDITQIAVFPPDVDPDQTSRWRPGFLEKIRGMNCFRFMDMFGTNNMNLARFEDFPNQASFPSGYAGRTVSIPIASIGPPAPDAFSDNVAGTVVRVVTTVPHGLTTGFQVTLRTTDGSSLGQVLGNVVDPVTNQVTSTARSPIDPTDGYQGQIRQNLCHVIDATTIQIGINVFNGPLARMVNTLTPTHGILHAYIAPGAMMAPADAAELCAEVGLEPWINVPWLANDDCVQRLAQAFANELPQGVPVHVEYGNEPWNFGFNATFYCIYLNNLNGIPGANYIPSYMTRMSQVHKIFQNVWSQAGRNPADVRRVCGVQYDNPEATTGLAVSYALANNISFDEVAPATYYSNGPASGPFDDLLTREQLLDLFAVNLQNSSLPNLLGRHTSLIATAFAQNPTQTWLQNVVLVNYEGGPDAMTTPTMSANIGNRNHAVHRDPAFCEIVLHHLQMLQDAGVKLFNIFSLYGTRYIDQWGVYEGFQMKAGTGDSTIDLDNLNDYENLLTIKSETGAALRKWSSMMKSAPVVRPILRNYLASGGILADSGIPSY